LTTSLELCNHCAVTIKSEKPSMKSITVALLALGLCIPALHAQNYSINWFTIDGGGGTSTGSVYTVSGTIGQPDAGHMSGGNYTLDGGFWAVIGVVQTPGAPLLRIQAAGPNSVLLAWPYPSTGFSLQQSMGVSPTSWAPVTNNPVQVGPENQVTITPALGNNYFRLKFP
jgi:hypothetical protein